MATLAQERKEKRWNVFSKAHNININSTGVKEVRVYDEVLGREDTGGTLPTYHKLSSASRPAWVLEAEDVSFEEAKAKVIELASVIGLDNVKMVRVVDLYTVLYPIA